MADARDDLITALVAARERHVSRDECVSLVRDVFNAPWSMPDEIVELARLVGLLQSMALRQEKQRARLKRHG